MKDTQKTIAFILFFSWMYGYLVASLQPIFGSIVVGNIVSAGFVSGVLFLLYELWRNMLWKVPILSDILCFLIGFRRIPNLSGTWNTNYTSSFMTPSGRAKRGKGRLIIEQSYDRLSIVDGVFPKSSGFESTFVGLEQKSNGRWFLVYAYTNTPEKPFNSPLGGRHTGFTYLEVKDNNLLKGYYATDKLRNTYGDIIFTKQN